MSLITDYLRSCPVYRVQLPGPAGGSVDVNVTQLKAPTLPGAETVGITVGTGAAGDPTANLSVVNYFIGQRDGVQVSVFGINPPGAPTDPAPLRQVLTAGADKVKNR